MTNLHYFEASNINLKDILLITPPFTQLNTPYPATAYLKGFLKTKSISSFQMDLGIEVILQVFTKKTFKLIFDAAEKEKKIKTENAKRIFALQNEYLKHIEPVIGFLQGKNPALARQLCLQNFLPQAKRFDQIDDLEWAFGNMGFQDMAKHLATLFIEDLSDFIVECVDENFGFSRYAERIAMSANSFDELYTEINNSPSFIDNFTIDILNEKIKIIQPKLICFSVPFPGNLYSAFRCAKFIKENFPEIKTAMGGGFPNTELREIKDKRVFEFIDFISLDDGELPIELIHSNVVNPNEKNPNNNLFKRTFLLEKDEIIYNNFSFRTDYKQAELGTPDYSDLLLDSYISVIEIANPMHSLWSDGRWNKLTMAHGCYWKKCTFCDISLDYIQNYEPLTASLLVDRMETLIAQTDTRGFHFVDEAAPPALMRSVAIEILKRNLSVSWWTNIRFEKSFSADLCILLKASGCIAVSGGLEVASDRLLKIIDKGVTVEQVAQVTANFTNAGIMVHAYLMYGYPSQTIQETIDSLEMVKQMFQAGILQSGFWHQFALTAHSPIGQNPADYGIFPEKIDSTFALNDIQFVDSTGIDHKQFSFGLKKSLYNYMHGLCFEFELQEWFDFEIPQTSIPMDHIEACLNDNHNQIHPKNAKLIWLGNEPIVSQKIINKKKQKINALTFQIYTNNETIEIVFPDKEGQWLKTIFPQFSAGNENLISLSKLKTDFEKTLEHFDVFWYSPEMDQLRNAGLLVL